MKDIVDTFLEEKRKEKSAKSKSKEGFPSAFNELYSYVFKIKYDTDENYKKHIDRTVEELEKEIAELKDIAFEESCLNAALSFWETEREEILEEIDCYASLPVEQQQSSYFHNIAIGLWEAWVKGYIQDIKLLEIVKCLNTQLLITGKAPQFNKGQKDKGGARRKIDKINVLMTFIDLDLNVTNTGKKLGKDPSEVRRHLKSIVGEDYMNLLNEHHKYYEITQFAYTYWSNNQGRG